MSRPRWVVRDIKNSHRAPMVGVQSQRGAASLIVVMVLFFLMSLVAAYTSRNLIFEQRVSLNQYRSTQAFEAAEAGLEWALAMLNSGRINAACLELPATIADTSFRQRYLNINPVTGPASPNITAKKWSPAAGVDIELTPSCVFDGTDWTCSCPSNGAPVLAAPGVAGVFPAFRIRFTSLDAAKPGVIRIESNGCTRAASDCLDFPVKAVESEGRATVTALVALRNALSTPPSAAITVLGKLSTGSAVNVYNTEPDRGGIAVQAGGALELPNSNVFHTIPGTSAVNARVFNDTSLSSLSAAPDRVFASSFGVWPATYRLQPAAVQVACPVGDCRADLANAVARNPDRVIWVVGDLTLGSAGDVGSLPDPANPAVAGPAAIVVTGKVHFTAAGVRIFGFIYSRTGDWLGPGEVQGAAFIEGDLAATAAATVVMNGTVLDALGQRHGSFVRIPGGWKDFK